LQYGRGLQVKVLWLDEVSKQTTDNVKSKIKDVVGILSLKRNGQLISHNEKQANIAE